MTPSEQALALAQRREAIRSNLLDELGDCDSIIARAEARKVKAQAKSAEQIATLNAEAADILFATHGLDERPPEDGDVDPPKRHRRTKAQIAADEAAKNNPDNKE